MGTTFSYPFWGLFLTGGGGKECMFPCIEGMPQGSGPAHVPLHADSCFCHLQAQGTTTPPKRG